jgi:phenylacetate-CoA ligase
MLIWNKKNETMTRSELKQFQLERLQQTLSRVYRRVSYYHNLFNQIGFDPLELTSLEDLKKIPFTTKDTLRIAYPYDMFAVPLREVVRMQSTWGTTGQPLIVGYTKNDIDHWTELRRYYPDLLSLRPVYWWYWIPLRSGEDRCFSDSLFRHGY